MTLSPIIDENEEEPDNTFGVFQAFYHDLEDPSDNLAYYYLSFLLDGSMFIVKVDVAEMTVKESVKYAL
jgi:hypothetical protein